MSAHLSASPRAALEAAGRGAQRGLREAGALLLSASQAQVPVDSGALRDSASVETNRLQSVVSYGAPHAAIVHEDARPRRRGKAKFLEDAANDPALHARMLRALAAAIALELDKP